MDRVIRCEALAAGLFGEAGSAGVGHPDLDGAKATGAEGFAMLAHTLPGGELLLGFESGRVGALCGLHEDSVTCNDCGSKWFWIPALKMGV